jgi:EspA/EspE family
VTVIGALIEDIASRAGLQNIREAGERLANSGAVEAEAAGSDLLDLGQSIITGMKSTTGLGSPYRGEAFDRARTTFNGVTETLKSAVPIGWNGEAADAYADQNTRQQLRSEAMADADHEVHRVLEREAAQITLRRRILDDQHMFLADTSYVTFPLKFIPHYGQAMTLAIEIAALQTAVGESRAQLHQLDSEMAQNAAELQQAVGRYSNVADGVEMPSAAVSFDRPTPGTNAAGGGDALPAEHDPESARPHTPVTARLDSDNPPGPPAGNATAG